tara:strand:- start:1004 stop:2869 length:1866 start_codon:yes stop_codon:yes gene_type:complete
MPLAKYIFTPGINREGTNYSNENGWYDADKVRFRKGRPERIGGWDKSSINSFIGTCRKLHPYKAIDGDNFIILGTHQKLYVLNGNVYYDITPIRATTTNGITFAATNGSSTLTVTDDDHGAVTGDFVTIAGAVSLGGLITAAVLNQEYQISLVIGTDTYQIEAKDTDGDAVTANASDSGNGGAGVDGVYQINSGLDVYVSSTGWGASAWNTGTFGSKTDLTLTNQLRLWSIDNFGDDTIAAPRAGNIYFWDESDGLSARATLLSAETGASDVPTAVIQVMTSDVDKHCIAFGSNPIGSSTIDPLLVRFSDRESAVDWTPTATNQAGGVQLSQGSEIIGALRTRQEILIWTDVGIISMRFVGEPFVFSFTEVAEGPSLISPNAAVSGNNRVYFMDNNGFYVYSGSAEKLSCTVLDYVLSDLNKDQAFKVFAAINNSANEIMWFYPSGSNLEINKYVLFNYLENVWSIGTTDDNFTRTAWDQASILEYPLAASKNDTTNLNYIYNHEKGHGDNGSSFTAYIESSDFDLEPDGERFTFISKLIPDVEFRDQTGTDNSVTYTIKGRDYPLQSLSTLQTIDVTPNSTFSNTRARSRQAAIRISNSSSDYGWRAGDLRLEIRPDGKR